jgi:acyl-homoserine-lactone acylase
VPPQEEWFKELLAIDPKGDNLVADARDLLSHWDWSWDGKGPATSGSPSPIRAR